MEQYDIAIIGAGPGGYEMAVKAAAAGLKVAVVESGTPGGTCLNVGCIPTKCLCHSAEQAVAVGRDSVTLAAAMERKDAVVAQLADGVRSLLARPGITLHAARARFVDARTLALSAADGTESRLSARYIVVATGSAPRFLPIEGAHSRDVATSTEMLSLTAVPKRLVVIGGGVIGMEFASIYNAFGAEVTVLEYCKEILPPFDRDIAKRLRMALKKSGVNICTGAEVKAVCELPGCGSTVTYVEKGKEVQVEADKVLMAVGRTACTEGLDLEKVGIETGRGGIVVDENMQTSVPGVYAIGDVNGRCQLAHAATFQGFHALGHILAAEGTGSDELAAIRFDIMPAAVFTVPEVAMVGRTEEQLKAEGVDYKVRKSLYRSCGKALAMNESEGLVKLLEGEDGRILGCHILGAHASDLIHEAVVAMNADVTVAQLGRMIHAHPSLSEILLMAAH
ncbi:MAG: dihydrolipoyl dehydrogenase [Prevotellaceae bacterium]|nr:dihydrolipoyl dehydrogenase [Prevotellaceae bacterium]